MRKYIYLLLTVTFLVSGAKAQEVKKISGVPVTINNLHPDKFIFENEFVKILLKDASGMKVQLDIYNKTDKSMDFLWNDSYFVINGQTVPTHNFGISSVKIHAVHSEHIDVNKPQKIAPKANYIAEMGSNDKYIFGVFDADSYYKKNGTHLVNRVVPTLLIEGEKKEIPITIELYTKKQLKLKK